MPPLLLTTTMMMMMIIMIMIMMIMMRTVLFIVQRVGFCRGDDEMAISVAVKILNSK
jgi:hypothetical protein